MQVNYLLIRAKFNDIRRVETDRKVWGYSVTPSFIAGQKKDEDQLANILDV